MPLQLDRSVAATKASGAQNMSFDSKEMILLNGMARRQLWMAMYGADVTSIVDGN